MYIIWYSKSIGRALLRSKLSFTDTNLCHMHASIKRLGQSQRLTKLGAQSQQYVVTSYSTSRPRTQDYLSPSRVYIQDKKLSYNAGSFEQFNQNQKSKYNHKIEWYYCNCVVFDPTLFIIRSRI